MKNKMDYILRVLLAVPLVIGGGIYTFFLYMARLESADEFKFITIIDLVIGLFWCLPVFVLFGNWINTPRFYKNIIPYLLLAISISVFFLLLHSRQVIIRSGNPLEPFELLFSR